MGGQVEHTCLCAHMRVDVDTMQAVLEIREIVGLHWWGFHRIMTGLLGLMSSQETPNPWGLSLRQNQELHKDSGRLSAEP